MSLFLTPKKMALIYKVQDDGTLKSVTTS